MTKKNAIYLVQVLVTLTLATFIIAKAAPHIQLALPLQTSPQMDAISRKMKAVFCRELLPFDVHLEMIKLDEIAAAADAFSQRISNLRMELSPSSQPSPQEQATPAMRISTTSWGVLRKHHVKVYQRDGKYLCRLAAGTLVPVQGTLKTQSGDFACCPSVRTGDGETLADVLIGRNDLDIYSQPVEPPVRELCVQAAILAADMINLKVSYESGIRTDNPFAAAYIQSRGKYQDYFVHAENLRLRAENPDMRATCMDELRQMRPDGMRLEKELRRAKEQYETWNNANPSNPGKADPVLAELAEKETQLAALHRRIASSQHLIP